MANIIEFPTKAVQDWAVVERTLRHIMGDAGASNVLIDIVVERMKVAFDEHKFDYHLSLNLPQEYADDVGSQIEGFIKALQQHTTELLLSRLKIEIELAKYHGYV